MTEPLLTIVTGTLDRPKILKECVESIIEHTDIPYELIIADAGSQPITTQYPPHIKLLREWPREGHAKGYNKAFKAATGKWVCWLNDDARCTPGWATNAVRFMEARPWCGLGALYYSDHGGGFHVNTYYEMLYANFGILSREFGNEVGWFDECVRMYGADNSLAFKTMLAGRMVCAIPDARLLHLPVNDPQRKENVAGQPADAKALMDKYGPLIPEMKRFCHGFEIPAPTN